MELCEDQGAFPVGDYDRLEADRDHWKRRCLEAEAKLAAARNRIDDDTETIDRQCRELGRLRAGREAE